MESKMTVSGPFVGYLWWTGLLQMCNPSKIRFEAAKKKQQQMKDKRDSDKFRRHQIERERKRERERERER